MHDSSQANPRPRRRDWLLYWGTVFAWMVVIRTLSGEGFSAENTNRYLDPILRYLFPHLTPAGFLLAHGIIRKAAHFTEFFILGLLSFWASRSGRAPLWRWQWSVQSLFLAGVYALADETHQMFVPNRTGSYLDSLIDFSGAVASQICLFAWRHRQGSPRRPA